MRISLCCVAVFAVCLAGCGKDPADGMVETLGEMADLLSNVETKEDAEGVKDEFRELAKRYVDYANELGAMEKKTPKESMRFAKEVRTRMSDAFQKIFKAMQNPDIRAVLGTELDRLQPPN